MRDGLKMGVQGIELLNSKLGILELTNPDGPGWSEEVTSDMHRYEHCLERLYKKHWRKGSTAPELELAMLLFGSMGMYHFQRKMGGGSSKKPQQPVAPPQPMMMMGAAAAAAPPGMRWDIPPRQVMKRPSPPSSAPRVELTEEEDDTVRLRSAPPPQPPAPQPPQPPQDPMKEMQLLMQEQMARMQHMMSNQMQMMQHQMQHQISHQVQQAIAAQRQLVSHQAPPVVRQQDSAPPPPVAAPPQVATPPDSSSSEEDELLSDSMASLDISGGSGGGETGEEEEEDEEEKNTHSVELPSSLAARGRRRRPRVNV